MMQKLVEILVIRYDVSINKFELEVERMSLDVDIKIVNNDDRSETSNLEKKSVAVILVVDESIKTNSYIIMCFSISERNHD